MRIGINLFEFVPPGSRGAGVLRYLKSLLRGLAAIDRHNSYYLFINRQSLNEFDPLPENFHKVVVPLDARKRWTRVAWEQILMPFHVHRLDLDVIHTPTDTVSLAVLRRAVVTSYATNISYYQQYFPDQARGLKQRYLLMMQHLLTRAAAIITISEHSKQEIVKHLGASPEKMTVVYPAPERQIAPDPHALGPYPFPYVLCVSSSVVHKNLPALIRAYGILRRQMPSAPKLVLAGFIAEISTWGMHRRQELEQCIAEAGVTGEVIIESKVDEARLESLYRGAMLFVFPSLYEGFGLVVMEAMMYGIPVVSSDRASLPEVGRDAAAYINPDDPQSIADGMRHVLSDPALREAMVRRGYARLKELGGPERLARETLAVYERVAKVAPQAGANEIKQGESMVARS